MTLIIGVVSQKGGVGKTTLVYHLTWMFRELGHRVVAVDLDPQANLSSMFLSENRLEEIWDSVGRGDTLFEAVRPLLRGARHVDPGQRRFPAKYRLFLR